MIMTNKLMEILKLMNRKKCLSYGGWFGRFSIISQLFLVNFSYFLNYFLNDFSHFLIVHFSIT